MEQFMKARHLETLLTHSTFLVHHLIPLSMMMFGKGNKLAVAELTYYGSTYLPQHA